jgi:tetratricopeptide (TPR) repeat protein
MLGTATREQPQKKSREPNAAAPAENAQPEGADQPGHHAVRKSKVTGHVHRAGLPSFFGVLFAVLILLVSAGATIFFLTKPPDYERLYRQGQQQLGNGQYAFAVKTLEQAVALKPQESKYYLALARAYVGVDQIEKAWQCVGQAQQLGAALSTEPSLASDLANFYRSHQQWGRAVELLRPLAQAGVPGKKAELADLDAQWGDECIRTGELDQGLKCWEEVKSIAEGSRTSEVDSRLTTIYQRYANNLLSSNEDAKALDYLTKLNVIAPNAQNFEKVADIYERQGQFELAIDQLRRAAKLQTKNVILDRKLAMLMIRRGKELLDKGDAQAGLAYLQEARQYDARHAVPTIVLKSVTVSVGQTSRFPELLGEIWNPGPNQISALSVRFELFDTLANRVIWSKDERIVDEFVPPLMVNESKPCSITAPVAVRDNGLTEFKVYFADLLYKSYPVGVKTASGSAGQRAASSKPGPDFALKKDEKPVEQLPPPAAPDAVPTEITPAASPVPAPSAAPAPLLRPSLPTKSPEPASPAQPSGAEDKTLKDLDL